MNRIAKRMAEFTARDGARTAANPKDVYDAAHYAHGLVFAFQWRIPNVPEDVFRLWSDKLAGSDAFASGQVYFKDGGAGGGMSTFMALSEATSLLSAAISESGSDIAFVEDPDMILMDDEGNMAVAEPAAAPIFIVGKYGSEALGRDVLDNPAKKLKAAIDRTCGERLRNACGGGIWKRMEEKWLAKPQPARVKMFSLAELCRNFGVSRTSLWHWPGCGEPRINSEGMRVTSPIPDLLEWHFPGRDTIGVSELARALGVSRVTLWRMLKKAGVQAGKNGLKFMDAVEILEGWLINPDPANKAFVGGLGESLHRCSAGIRD